MPVEAGTNVARETAARYPGSAPDTTTPASAPIDTRATSTRIPTRTAGGGTSTAPVSGAPWGAACGAGVAGTARGCCMVRQAAATSQALAAAPSHAAPEVRHPRWRLKIRPTFR